jgi:UDPglucose 6-dehydrogenase
LITALQDNGATVRAYDPAGMEQAKTALSNVTFCQTPYACAEDADALVIATEWEQFRALDLDRLKHIMACPVVIDLRNIYRPEEMAQHGFIYDSVGRMPFGRPSSAAPSERSRPQVDVSKNVALAKL